MKWLSVCEQRVFFFSLGCGIRAIVSEVPLIYGIVAVVTGPKLTLV